MSKAIETLVIATEVEHEEILNDNQLSDECENPMKFYLDYLIAKREIEVRTKRKNELIDRLAALEFKYKMADTRDIADFIKREISGFKTELYKLLKMEKADNPTKNTHKYEYFKILELNRSSHYFAICKGVDGDGREINFDFKKITDATNLMFGFEKKVYLYEKLVQIYNASVYGSILVFEKDADLNITDISILDELPQHLLHEQKIQFLTEGSQCVARARASVMALEARYEA